MTQDAAWGVTSSATDDGVDVEAVGWAAEPEPAEDDDWAQAHGSASAGEAVWSAEAGGGTMSGGTTGSTTGGGIMGGGTTGGGIMGGTMSGSTTGGGTTGGGIMGGIMGGTMGGGITGGEEREAGEVLGFQEAPSVEAEPAVEGTGHPAVDAAVRAVANAEALPAAEQLAAYEGAHQTLREVLASIED